MYSFIILVLLFVARVIVNMFSADYTIVVVGLNAAALSSRLLLLLSVAVVTDSVVTDCLHYCCLFIRWSALPLPFQIEPTLTLTPESALHA